jgi:hypothetical protein
VLGALIEKGIKVAGFHPKRDNLEDLFLKVASAGTTEEPRKKEVLKALLGPSEQQRTGAVP